MSGRKNVSIDSYELAALRRQAAQATTLTQANAALNTLNNNLSNSLNAANSRINGLNTNINNLNRQLDANKREASAQVNALRTQLQNIIRESNQRLEQLSRDNQAKLSNLRSSFNDALSQTRSELNTTIEENNRRIQTAMDRNNRVLTDQINRTNNRIDVIDHRLDDITHTVNSAHNDLQTLRDMAQEFLDMARLLNADSANYRCELLLPGEFRHIQDQMHFANSQMQLPLVNSPAAQMSARQAYLSALDFHERVIQAEQAWILRHQAAEQAVLRAQGQIDANRQLTHNPTGVTLDVDYWSDGDLSELDSHAGRLLNHLRSDASNDSLEDLDNIRAAAEQLSEDALDTSAFALGVAVSSQERVNLAQELLDTLRSTNGLELEDHGYQGSDSRAAHRMSLHNNVTGLTLVVTQTPCQTAEGDLQNNIEVEIANPGTCNQQIAENIALDITHALQNVGYEEINLKPVPGFTAFNSGRQQTANIEQWRQESSTTVTKPVHRSRRQQQTQNRTRTVSH